MKIYIIGNKADERMFEQAEELLTKKGHIPINPIKISNALPANINNSDLIVMLFECIRISDAVYFLDGWEKDFIARLENAQSRRLDKVILGRRRNE